MRYNTTDSFRSYRVTLDNGKAVSVSAPSPQRARIRIERELAKRGSSLTIRSIREI